MAPASTRDVTYSYVSLALSPVFFLVAIAAGEGVVTACGYAVGGSYPWWVAVLSDASALALVLVPCSGAVVFGRRASRAGRRHGIIAAVLGAVIAVAWIVLTVASELANPL